MNADIIVALVGAFATIFVGALTLLGVIVSNKRSNDKLNTEIQHKLETAQAVTDTKIDELTREVRKHNGFAERMPVIEEKIAVINHRIEDLEGFHKPSK